MSEVTFVRYVEDAELLLEIIEDLVKCEARRIDVKREDEKLYCVEYSLNMNADLEKQLSAIASLKEKTIEYNLFKTLLYMIESLETRLFNCEVCLDYVRKVDPALWGAMTDEFVCLTGEEFEKRSRGRWISES